MEQRISGPKVAPEAYKIMYQFEYIQKRSVSILSMELIKIRASQINGCAFCLDMHTRDARAIGETEQRIYCLNAWRESPFYSDVERVTLELTETITLIATNRVSDDLYNRVRQHFDEKQYVDLIFLINTINTWNRLSISMNLAPGDH